MAVRILILERHALFGEAIRSALLDAKMDVLKVIPTGRAAIAFLERDQPDVLLIGLDLADSRANLMKRRPRKSDGLAIGRRILTRWPDANMILMSEWDDPQVIDGALKIGFRGYLSRAAPFPEFLKATRPSWTERRCSQSRSLTKRIKTHLSEAGSATRARRVT